MRRNIIVLSIVILFAAACSAKEAPPKELPTIEPLTKTSLLPEPTVTPTTEPTTTSTLKPTVDLEIVLTPQTTVEYELTYKFLITSDNVQIAMKKFGEGDLTVILAHQGTIGANQRDWEPFARMIAERGYRAVTLDFRGYGHSKGNINDKNYLIIDMRAVIDYLIGEGYERLVCIGASMGGSTCMRAAVEYPLDGLVVIGSMMNQGEPTNTTVDELASLTMPKLFITSENDIYAEIADSIKSMYKISQEPKEIRIFPGEAHGTQMFFQPYGEEFTAVLLAFLESVR